MLPETAEGRKTLADSSERLPVSSANRVLALDGVGADPRVGSYQPYWAARANLLARTGAHKEARHAYEIAIGLESDPAVREYLQERSEELPR